MKNKPYTKEYKNVGGINFLQNPITKDKPYLTQYPTVRQLKKSFTTTHPKNNKKGIRLVITKLGKGVFIKTRVFKQHELTENGDLKVIHHNIIVEK